MSSIPRFISDPHAGHKNVLNFPLRKTQVAIKNGDDHTGWLIEGWNAVVGKRDPVYVLGDIAFGRDSLEIYKELRGEKKLILGNHDEYPTHLYIEAGFKILPSLKKYRKKFWLSHAPIHPSELRGLPNIHGHIHDNIIQDESYLNVCAEHLNARPITMQEAEYALSLSTRDRLDYIYHLTH